MSVLKTKFICILNENNLDYILNSVQEIKNIANSRVVEARLLFDNNHFDGAVYLAGYTIELMFKAKICEILDFPTLFSEGTREVLKSFKTHKLEDLLILSGLSNKFQIAKSNDLQLQTDWSIIREWSESKRYCACGTCPEQEAENFLNAITNVKSWIEQQ